MSHLIVGALAVMSGLTLAAVAAWQYGPAWALIPALFMVAFGLALDDDR